MADPNPDMVNMDVLPTDDETQEEQAEENEEANEAAANTNTDELPLAAQNPDVFDSDEEREEYNERTV